MDKREITQELEKLGIDETALKNLGSIKTKINHDNYKQKLEYQKKKKKKSRNKSKHAKQSRKNNR
jgi:hypothetical protein